MDIIEININEMPTTGESQNGRTIELRDVVDQICLSIIDWMKFGNIECSANFIKMLESTPDLDSGDKEAVNRVKKLFDAFFEGDDNYVNYCTRKNIVADFPEGVSSKAEVLEYICFEMMSNFYSANLFDSFYTFYNSVAFEWDELSKIIVGFIINDENREVLSAYLISHNALAMAIMDSPSVSFAGITAVLVDAIKKNDE